MDQATMKACVFVSAILVSNSFAVTRYVALNGGNASAGVTQGLTAYYPLDGTAQDLSGNGNNGTAYNTQSATDRWGNANGAMQFNGVSAYINVGSAGLSNNPIAYTQIAWIKTSYAGSDHVIITRRQLQDYNMGWCTLMTHAGKGDLCVDADYHRVDVQGASNVANAVWHMIAGVRNSNQYTLFVDGLQAAQAIDNFAMPGSTSSVYIGRHAGWSRYFNGAIDDVYFYDRALNSNDIWALYTQLPHILSITSTAEVVSFNVSATMLAGTNSGCVGTLWASNAANNLVYPFPAADGWVSPEIALEVGANAIDVSGTSTFGVLAQDSVVITRKAATPTGVAASDGTFTGKVALAWLAAPGAVSYRILRAETNDSSAAITVATAVSNTVYDDTSATPGLLYYYWVIAQQNGVEGDPSAPDSGYRQLAASSSIAATLGYYTNNVVVSWAAVEGATKYRVYRADSALTNIADLIGSDITDTNYSDNTVTPGLVYYYWVQAQSAVAAGAWCGAEPGYALLAANFLDKKTWSMRDTKKMDTLTCKQLPGPWSALFNSSWRVAIVNASTHEIVSGPFELVTKNGKKYTYKSALATITYTQNYNKRKDTYKCKLIFKFAGAMPTQPGVFLQQPMAGVSVRQ
jgi:hypothetical protein